LLVQPLVFLRRLHFAVEGEFITRKDVEVRGAALPHFGLGEAFDAQAE